jgi:large subunit ribosomal protein L5
MYKSRLKELYETKVTQDLKSKFSYGNIMEVPKLQKIVVSMGVKGALVDSKEMDRACDELYLITGQKPKRNLAKKSIAAFKLRVGAEIGCQVTLRNDMMYDFMDRLINIALPRVKDFRGLNSKNFDGRGNYSMGIKEQLIFPEINYDKVDKVRGMNIAIVTTAKSDEEGLALLKSFNFPFKKN